MDRPWIRIAPERSSEVRCARYTRGDISNVEAAMSTGTRRTPSSPVQFITEKIRVRNSGGGQSTAKALKAGPGFMSPPSDHSYPCWNP